MTIGRALIQDVGGLPRSLCSADVLASMEVIPAAIATAAITITGAQLALGWINRTGLGGAGTDTIDSAGNIITALSQGYGLGMTDSISWRVSWYNPSASVITVAATANTGVTVTNGTVNAGSVKDFLVTVVDGTLPVVLTGNATNASAIITGVPTSIISQVGVGQIVTNAIVGLQGQTVIRVDIAKQEITLSGNANATQAVSLNLSPQITVFGIGQKLV